MRHAHFLIPGDIHTATGGYAYDREIAAALTRAGWKISIEQLAEDLALPEAKAAATRCLEALPDDALVLVDGLALADLAAPLASHSRRLRLVAIVHHPAALETGLSEARASEIARSELLALRTMNSVVCTSDWTARTLSGLGLTSAPIHVVEPGTDIGAARRETQPMRRAPATAHAAGLRLLCVATITPRKGHDLLVRALARLADLHWSLTCIGSRERAPLHVKHVEALIQSHALQDRITMAGEVDRSTLIDAYEDADLFVLASKLEGYGMVLAEARAAGLPIVATRGGAVAETLADAAAVVVEPDSPEHLADALRAIIAQQQVWLALAGAAREKAQTNRTWELAAAELAAALIA